jgi:hypothetical protein
MGWPVRLAPPPWLRNFANITTTQRATTSLKKSFNSAPWPLTRGSNTTRNAMSTMKTSTARPTQPSCLLRKVAIAADR